MSTRLRGMKYREVTERLKKLGFRFYRRGKGSHGLWVRDSDGKTVPVPHYGQARCLPYYGAKEIRKETVVGIVKEIGLTVKEFMELD